jgi:hypothetical protein
VQTKDKTRTSPPYPGQEFTELGRTRSAEAVQGPVKKSSVEGTPLSANAVPLRVWLNEKVCGQMLQFCCVVRLLADAQPALCLVIGSINGVALNEGVAVCT